MAINAAQLVAEVSVSGADDSETRLFGVGDVVDSVAGKLAGGIVGAGLEAGKALLGFAGESIHAAADFQESMSKVEAYAGLTKQQTDDLGNSILSLASAMGQSPKAMADALYPIISSGYSASQALQILKLSAETSAASGANMAVVADALTTSLKAMHAPASDATSYMDMLNKVVSLGKGEVPQYAAVIGKLSLAASSAKVPFNDMGAALATLTTHGFPSVAQASTSLGNLFTQIGPKVDAVATHAHKLGLSFDESKFKSMDLSDKLSYLSKVTDGNQGELLKLVGGNTLALKAFNALHGSVGDFTSNLNAMRDATGMTNSVFQTTYGDWNNSVNRLNSTFDVLKIKAGQELLPILTPLLQTATSFVSTIGNWILGANGLGAVFSYVGNVFRSLNLTDFHDAWQSLSSAVGVLMQQLSSLGSVFSQVGTDADPIANMLGTVMKSALSAVTNLIWDAYVAISAISQGMQTGKGPIADVGGLFTQIGKVLSDDLVPVFQQVSKIIGGQLGSDFQTFVTQGKQVSGWFETTLLPAIQKALPPFENLAGVLLKTVVPALAQLWADGNKLEMALLPVFLKIGEVALPIVLKLASFLASVLGPAIQFLVPYVLQAAAAVTQFGQEIAARLLPIITQLADHISMALDVVMTIWHAAWPVLAPIVKGVFDIIVGVIQVAWSVITGIFKIALDVMSGNWGQAWNDLVSMLGGVWHGIQTVISGGLEILNGMFLGLPAEALKWGEDMISGFIQGIKNMIGGIGNAVSGIGGVIKNFLHFSKPDMGPLADADQWMPDMLGMFTSQIKAGAPALSAALSVALQPMAAAVSPASMGGMASPSYSLPSMPTPAQSSSSGQPIIMTIDGHVIGRAVLPHIASAIRQSVSLHGS